MKHALAFSLMALATLAVPASGRAGIQVTVVPASSWGAADAELGLAGGVVEDFEDRELAPGLLLELSAPGGVFPGEILDALPAVFDPVGDDPYGDAFAVGVWDGSHVLLNIPGNESVYYGETDYRRVRLRVPTGAAWIGFSLQQLTVNDGLFVNGVSLGRVASLGLEPSQGRNGYVIVASDDRADPVTSVTFGGQGDAFVVDHVSFAPAAGVPASEARWGEVKALFR